MHESAVRIQGFVECPLVEVVALLVRAWISWEVLEEQRLVKLESPLCVLLVEEQRHLRCHPLALRALALEVAEGEQHGLVTISLLPIESVD